MKNTAILFAVLLAATGCDSLTNDEPRNAPIAEQYFFPQTSGVLYTYSEHQSNVLDTSTYQVTVSAQYNSFAKLLKQEGGLPSNDVLYFYKTTTDNNGVLQCLMSPTEDPDDAIVALQGTLDVGSSWLADDAGMIEATVVAHYETFLLPGHENVYEDVVVVKYCNKAGSQDKYTLRFFARDYGIILERSVVGQTSEIANLQLISTKRNTSEQSPRDPNIRWYDANHRYIIMPNIENDETEK